MLMLILMLMFVLTSMPILMLMSVAIVGCKVSCLSVSAQVRYHFKAFFQADNVLNDV